MRGTPEELEGERHTQVRAAEVRVGRDHLDAKGGPEGGITGVAEVDVQAVDDPVVRLEHTACPRGESHARHHTISGSLHRSPSEQWADGSDIGMGTNRVPDLVDREDRPDRERGIRRCDHDGVGSGDRLDHTGGGNCLLRPLVGECHDGVLMVAIDEVLLECEPFALIREDQGPERVVRGGQERDVGDTEAVRKLHRHPAERFPVGERLGPGDTQGEVPVPEREARVVSEIAERIHDHGGVASPPPTMRSHVTGEGVEHGVRVGRHVNAVSFRVVTDVDDDVQLARLEHGSQGAGHPCAADSAGEQHHPVIAVTVIRLQNAPHMSMTPTRLASVATIVMADGTGELDETLAAVGRQLYETGAPLVVGSGQTVERLSDAIDALPRDHEYVWIVREGAIAYPDTLSALVRDAERTGAGIIGSKVIGDDDALISVGLVTDVFGVPYTGLDESERDQGQYDVVRDVAAVAGVSMLVRRDLLHGLRGFDPDMAPLAASIDLARRARLKGARVMISPASSVHFDGEEAGPERWKEEGSRLRSNFKCYGVLTLLWVTPIDLIIGFIEAIVSLFFGKWLVFDYVRSWAWAIGKTPSTIAGRGLARRNRAVGDADLFRFQRRGSVKMSVLVEDTLTALRRRLPGDDTLSVASIGRDVRQPAFVIGVIAALFVLLSARNLWSDGFPAIGYTLPFPANGWDVLDAYAGGWNPAGLGSAEPLRPLLALAGLAKIVTLHGAVLAEYILGAGAMLLGIWGTVRLLRTWSIPAAPGLIAGVVYVAGPTAQGIAGNTHLGSLLALGVLPWAIRLCLAPVRDGLRPLAGRLAAVVLVFGVLGAASPLMVLIPVPVLAVYALMRFTDPRAWRGVIMGLFATGGGVLLLSPWIWENNFESLLEDGYAFWEISPVLSVAGAVVATAAVIAAGRSLGVVAGWGALLAGAGFLLARSGSYGLGTEAESMGLALSGLGLAIVIGIVAATVSDSDAASWRRFAAGLGSVAVVLLLVAASTIVLGGRIGLPGDRFTDTLSFTMANEGEAARSRVLLVGPEDLMPGDSRTVDGGAYRVVSAPVPDLGEARLAQRGALDDLLLEAMRSITSGETRRAGAELAPFGIRWIVVLGDSDGSDADEASLAWREVFAGQLDLLPLSAGVSNAVFVTDTDPVGRALTSSAASWPRVGWTYTGEPEAGKSVFVAENPAPSFGPEPWSDAGTVNQVAADEGVVTYRADEGRRLQSNIVAISIFILGGLAWWGRRRS